MSEALRRLIASMKALTVLIGCAGMVSPMLCKGTVADKLERKTGRFDQPRTLDCPPDDDCT
jgi:hypothetical protein